MQDPYITLGIRENVGDAEVQAAYHRRLRQFPPEDCPQEFAAISEAYELLRTELDRVTFATSLYGPENLIFLILDHPALAERLSRLILEAMEAKIRLHWREAGLTEASAPRGFFFL